MIKHNLIKEMPIKASLKKNMKFRGGTYDVAVAQKGNAFDLYKFCRDVYRDRKEGKIPSPSNYNDGGLFGPNVENNNDYMVYQITDDHPQRSEFKGGTGADLFERDANMARYLELKKKFSASDLFKKSVTALGHRPLRKRVRCEYDGEFDFDKRWDSQPFSRSVRRMVDTKIVKLFVEISFSGSVSSSVIDEYGAFIAFLVELFENQGILVELNVCHTGTNFIQGHVDSLQRDVFLLKKSNQYLPTSTLVKFMSSNFYRRCIFSTIISSAEAAGRTVSGGLGTPFGYGKVWEVNKDCIFIYSVPDHDQQHQITSKLLKMLNPDMEIPEAPPKKQEARKDYDEIPF